MSDLENVRQRINDQFLSAFGRTPLKQRIDDIVTQTTSVSRHFDLSNLQEETGDLLCSVLQLCNECGWDPADLISATLKRIEARIDIYKRLGRKLRVALLGGAFDPIHRGHLEVARTTLQHGGVDEVWLMPCHEHLAGKSMVAPEHRLKMCEIAAQSVRGVSVFNYELRHRFRGETYHTVKSLLSEEIARNQCDFSLVIGQDNADGFASWTNGEALEQLIPFIVLPRGGCEATKPDAWYLRPPHRLLSSASSTDSTSSTEIRRLLWERNPAAEKLLPPGVFEYILDHALYQPEVVPRPIAVRSTKTAIFISTFDPPSLSDRVAVHQLLENGFDRVVISPAFTFDTSLPELTASMNTAALVALNFDGLPETKVDFSELERANPTGFGCIEKHYEDQAEVWLVVDAELVSGGSSGRSLIHTGWEYGIERWNRARFVVLHEPGAPPNPADLPPQHRLLPIKKPLSTCDLRHRVYARESTHDLLTANVANYIERHRLFQASVPGITTRWRISQPRLLIEYDEKNPKAVGIADRFRSLAGDPPNVILVIGGDGTMLKAIGKYWPMRIPFLGLNAGHLGFLSNQRLSDGLADLDLVTYLLPMLRVESTSIDGSIKKDLAFSDAWVERDSGQAAWLRLDVDNQTRVNKIVGDGMLVATASGSSAYARALGASPLPLNTPALTLAGSNVFEPRFWKPMALNHDAVISLVSLDQSGKRPVRGFVDGSPLGNIQRLTVDRSPVANVELAFVGEFDPTSKLLQSFFPPAEGIVR